MPRMTTSDFTDLIGGTMVDIHIGSKRKKWTVHKDLICSKSPFFEKAFSGTFKESINQSIYLSEDHPFGFELLVHWLYRGHLPEVISGNVKSGGNPLDSSFIFKLMEFFIQAEKFLLPDQVKIDALDHMLAIRRMVKVTTKPVRLEMLGRVLEAVPDDSPLRTLVLDFVCNDFDTKDKFMDSMREELAREDSNFDILVFFEALKERYQSAKFTTNHSPYDPTREFASGVSIKDMPRYQTGFLSRAPSPQAINAVDIS